MRKLQILFPEPQLRRLREIAGRQDRPVSELVRNAVDLWMERHGDRDSTVLEEAPVYRCGPMLAEPGDLRSLANADREPG